jgi:hypothetical protein
MSDTIPQPININVICFTQSQARNVYLAAAGCSVLEPTVGTPIPTPVTAETETVPGNALTGAAVSVAADKSAPLADAEASPPVSEDVELDADGHPWSEDLHASTKGKTKDGLWRMKPGQTRPDRVPGYLPPEAEEVLAEPDTAEPDTAEPDDDFAEFEAAAAKQKAEAAAAAENTPEREWTDADLSALCNQAAQKLGDPTPVKELIAKFVKEDDVAHSRNIAADDRPDFVAAVEKAAEIEFAG